MADEMDLLATTAGDVFDAISATGRDGPPDELSRALWKALDAQGMARVSAPAPHGAGESLRYLGAVLRAAGRSAVSVPVLDTHVGAVLLDSAKGPDDGGALSVGLDAALFAGPSPAPATGAGSRSAPAAVAVYSAGLSDQIVLARHEDDHARIDVWWTGQLEVPVSRNVAGEPLLLLDAAKIGRAHV